MKNIIVSMMVASTVALLAPTALPHVAMLSMRAGVLLISFGLFIDPVPKEERHDQDHEHMPYIERAGYYPDTPMPDRPGCEVTHCVPLWDGYRHGQRCYWRCPRPRPRSYYATPHVPRSPYQASSPAVDTDVVPVLLIAGIIAAVAVIIIVASSSTSSLEKDVLDTEALTGKLEDAAREADERIGAYLKKLQDDADG